MDLVGRYLTGYSEVVRGQVSQLIQDGALNKYLESRYPTGHTVKTDSELRRYVLEIKNQYIKKSSPLSKVVYDSKIHVINNALGTHTYVNRVQGSKIKSKNELRISSIFKRAPEALLNMIVVHELAHLKEREHNKSFYKLCLHMLPDYYQLEFDTRLFLIGLDIDR